MNPYTDRRIVVHVLKPGQALAEVDAWPGDKVLTETEVYVMKSTGDYERCNDACCAPLLRKE